MCHLSSTVVYDAGDRRSRELLSQAARARLASQIQHQSPRRPGASALEIVKHGLGMTLALLRARTGLRAG
jgi:hypothetical protein